MSNIQVICGSGIGKTSAAIGYGIRAAGSSKEVIVVQFLKGSESGEYHLLSRLEPEVKLLRFERVGKCYDQLTKEEQSEQKANIMNGFHYARKVIQTQGCDVLILDEILGLIDSGIASEEEIIQVLDAAKDCDMEILMTGRVLPPAIEAYAHVVTRVETSNKAIDSNG